MPRSVNLFDNCHPDPPQADVSGSRMNWFWMLKQVQHDTLPKWCIKYYPTIVIARLDRAIQKKKLDSPVKPENDKKELTFSEL